MTGPGSRVALITGATGAIGRAIALGIAATPGFEVVLAARDRAKAEAAQRDLRARTGNGSIRYELADLSRRGAVEALAARFDGPLHVLVNNAAVAPRHRLETADGIELQFATNVLSYVWMMESFADRLAASAPARIVNVASYWAGGLDLEDLQFVRRRYDNDAAYRQSKQANRMLAVAYADRLERRGIAVSSCHPGDVSSRLSNDLGFGGHESPEQGAQTPVWLATTPAGAESSGRYFEHRRESTCRFASDRSAVDALYKACQRFV